MNLQADDPKSVPSDSDDPRRVRYLSRAKFKLPVVTGTPVSGSEYHRLTDRSRFRGIFDPIKFLLCRTLRLLALRLKPQAEFRVTVTDRPSHGVGDGPSGSRGQFQVPSGGLAAALAAGLPAWPGLSLQLHRAGIPGTTRPGSAGSASTTVTVTSCSSDGPGVPIIRRPFPMAC